MGRCLALLLLMVPLLAAAESRYSRYAGSAVGYEDGAPLYDEEHFLRQEAGVLVERVVLYRCPGGAAFARKHMQQGADDSLRPTFEMRDARLGYVEGFRRVEAGYEVYFQRGKDAELEVEALELPEELVADAGFDAFVRKHWAVLMGGEKMRFDFLVPSRLDYMSFKVQHLRADQEAGVPAQVFRLSLSGVLSWFVDGIDVWYADADRSLLRFDGLSNVRNPDGENYTARIRFPASAVKDDAADATLFEQALAQDLVGSCAP